MSWWKAVEPPKRELHAQQEAQAEPIAAYKTFEVKSDHKETLSAIAQAAVEGRTRKPIEWLTYAPYLTDKALNDEFRAGQREQPRECRHSHLPAQEASRCARDASGSRPAAGNDLLLRGGL